jgi:hypothetical protein
MYRYGLVARPFAEGNCPPDFHDVEEFDTWTDAPGDDPRPVRAIVTYEEPLTQAQLQHHSLSQVGPHRFHPDVECVCHALTHGERLEIGPWRLHPSPEGWVLTGPNFRPITASKEIVLARILADGLGLDVDTC